MADIFDVLSDPTRRELLGRLLAAGQDGELPVGALVELTGLSQPTVSKHLKVLRDQGLVAVREEAQHRFYRLEPEPLVEVQTWLAPFVPAAVGTPARLPNERSDSKGSGSASEEIFAWSGAAAGEQLGRTAATTLYQARTVLARLREATAAARERLVDAGEQLTDLVKQALPVNTGEE